MLDYLSHFISVHGQVCTPAGNLKEEDGVDPPFVSFLLNSNMVVAIIKGLPVSVDGNVFNLGYTFYTNVTIDR
jgi:hypothetical protein